MVDKKIAYIIHCNIHKRLKTKNFMKLKPKVVMEHLQICGVLWCVEVQTKTFKRTSITHQINFKQVNKWKTNYKHGSNQVLQMSQNL